MKHISNALLAAAKSQGIYVDDLAKDFNKEIDYQMKKFGLANATFLNTFEKKNLLWLISLKMLIIV